MFDIHITDFYNDLGRALSYLYSQFPRPVTLWVDDLCGPDQPDEYGLHSPRHLACFGAVLWLRNEGYIDFGDVEKQEAFNHCVLTERGFTLLAGIDLEGDNEVLPAHQLRQAIMDGTSDDVEAQVKTLIRRNQRYKQGR